MATMLEVIFSIFIILLVLWIAISSIRGFVIGAPILYSPKRATEEALKAVDAKPGERFVDLGMGNGRSLIIAAKKFGLDVSGYEMSPIIFWLAKLNLFLHGIGKSRLFMKNFYKEDLSRNDIIFCFLTPPAMKRLRDKFEKELKKGTRVISYGFRIDGWQEKEILNPGLPGKIFIYQKD